MRILFLSILFVCVCVFFVFFYPFLLSFFSIPFFLFLVYFHCFTSFTFFIFSFSLFFFLFSLSSFSFCLLFPFYAPFCVILYFLFLFHIFMPLENHLRINSMLEQQPIFRFVSNTINISQSFFFFLFN